VLNERVPDLLEDVLVGGGGIEDPVWVMDGHTVVVLLLTFDDHRVVGDGGQE
jgi:hypothetical protein